MKSVMLHREEITRKVILPLFGLGIQVTETDADLVVTAIQLNEPRPMRYPAYEDLADPEGRVKDLLSGFDEDRKLSRSERSKAPHFVFANAKTPSVQVKFIQDFGPVFTRNIDRPTSRTVTAHQNKEILRFEQQLYSLIFDLIQLVNDLIPFSRQAFKAVTPEMRVVLVEHPDKFSDFREELDYTIREHDRKVREVDSRLKVRNILTQDVRGKLDKLRELLSKINEFLDLSPEDNPDELLDNPTSWRNYRSYWCTQEKLSKASSLDVIDRANDLLCRVFNRFPLILCYADGMAQEMPDTDSYGILPALYYMLRLEYLYEREIRRCANPNCGGYFVPNSKSRWRCSDSCTGKAEAQRNRDRKKAERDAQRSFSNKD